MLDPSPVLSVTNTCPFPLVSLHLQIPMRASGPFLHFYINNFLGIDFSSSSSRYLQSNQITLLSALEKNQKVWVLVSVSFFLSVFLFSESVWKCEWLKIKVSFWWIPQLWTFLRFSWTECWTTLTRPWFFQERLDHRVMQVPPNLVLYDCMVWCQM